MANVGDGISYVRYKSINLPDTEKAILRQIVETQFSDYLSFMCLVTAVRSNPKTLQGCSPMSHYYLELPKTYMHDFNGLHTNLKFHKIHYLMVVQSAMNSIADLGFALATYQLSLK